MNLSSHYFPLCWICKITGKSNPLTPTANYQINMVLFGSYTRWMLESMFGYIHCYVHFSECKFLHQMYLGIFPICLKKPKFSDPIRPWNWDRGNVTCKRPLKKFWNIFWYIPVVWFKEAWFSIFSHIPWGRAFAISKPNLWVFIWANAFAQHFIPNPSMVFLCSMFLNLELPLLIGARVPAHR